MNKIKKKSFVLIPHVKGCYAVKNVKDGSWDTPWSGIPDEDEPTFFANINGGGHGRTLWLRIKCNSTECNAIKAVNADVVNHA